MTQIIKKEIPWSSLSGAHKSPQKELNGQILSCLFREECFVSFSQDIKALSEMEMRQIATKVRLPYKIVRSVITKFLVDLFYFRRFLRSYKFTYAYTKSLRKLVIYLHKLHRLAPVFDFPRAKENARILKHNLSLRCFLPQFATQLAIVLYVTDLNDHNKQFVIKQSNLRLLCDCSAYAFHRTRNKLGLGSKKSYP
ncbi:MAG: hypothetical protein ACFFA3_10730 [Promethearchaeota archaeon]